MLRRETGESSLAKDSLCGSVLRILATHWQLVMIDNSFYIQKLVHHHLGNYQMGISFCCANLHDNFYISCFPVLSNKMAIFVVKIVLTDSSSLKDCAIYIFCWYITISRICSIFPMTSFQSFLKCFCYSRCTAAITSLANVN